MARILIIDDEEPIRFSLRGILEDEGYEVLEAATAEEGLEVADAERPDLVFLDIWLPGMDGLTAQARLKGNHPDLPVVMISGHGTIETAVSAIQQGAYDFIEKPLSLEKVVIVAARALEAGSLRRENQVLRTVLPEQDELIGQSPVMLKFQELLARVAPTDVWVLLTGENGTGKELAARALHAGSRRADAPMIAVNCAAIPEELIESELFGHEKGAFTSADQARAGRFEMANNGTLFLDEIGDMSLKTQAKILRILQEQSFERVGGTRTIKVDVRVIAATNKNLEEAIAAGTFREDLYYRLRVVPLHLPPLRERGGDLDLLLAAFTERLCRVHACKAPVHAAEHFQLLHREEAAQRQHRVHGRRAVALGHDEAVAVGIVRSLRVDVHDIEIERGQNVDAAQRAARMAGGRVVDHLHAQQARLGGFQAELGFLGFVHMNSFLCRFCPAGCWILSVLRSVIPAVCFVFVVLRFYHTAKPIFFPVPSAKIFRGDRRLFPVDALKTRAFPPASSSAQRWERGPAAWCRGRGW